jgi:hypothetical protein
VENRSDDMLVRVFTKVFISEFLKASAIFGKFQTAHDGSSFYDLVSKDPPAAIAKLTDGRSEKLLQILIEDLQCALIEWALQRMEEKGFKRRTESVLADFWNRVFLQIGVNPKIDVVKLSQQMRLELPIRTPRSSSFPYEKLKEITETYAQALDAASRIKKIQGRPSSPS